MIEGLNDEQSLAAECIDGPVIVFAGAGSGKTRTLTYRIINMIVNHHINPYNILAITFTNKATNVMKERIKAYIDVDSRNLTITTFHSLCASILRQHIDKIGYKTNFTIIDEDDQITVINEVLEELGYQKKQNKKYQAIIKHNKCFMTSPGFDIDKKVFDCYNSKLKEFNLIDFEDLLIKLYELFTLSKETLELYQEKFKYILCDEFQDTNLIQYKILKLLSGKYKNIFVVGDDDQSIYGFRGANYENIRMFKEDFENYSSYTLRQNYRSRQSILDCTNRLISYNQDRESKNLFSDILGESDDVVSYKAIDQIDEAMFIASEISKLHVGLTSYKDFAILYRNSVLLRNIERELINKHIPYKVYGGVSYMKRKEVKDILAYFKLMLNYDDTFSFKRIVNTPNRGIGLATIEKIENIRLDNNINYLEAIEKSKDIIPNSKYDKLISFKDTIWRFSNDIREYNLCDCFDSLIDEIEYIKYLKEEFSEEEAKDRIDNVKEFRSVLLHIEEESVDKDKIKLLERVIDDAMLNDSYKRNQSDNSDGVTVSTIHSIKGLEFDTVFVCGLEEGLFPKEEDTMYSKSLEEERRIAYVAMTRAKNKLYLTYAKRRLLYGFNFVNKESRFFNEALGVDNKYIDTSEKIKTINNKYDGFDKKQIENKPLYKTGDIIIHTKFGQGMILSIDNGIGTIFFDSLKTTKSLLLSHPSISKK